MRLKGGRDYERTGGQLRRVKQSPPTRKRCCVYYKGWPCQYNEATKTLVVAAEAASGQSVEAYEFSSKSKAQSAIWRSVLANGIPADHVNYKIEIV